MVNADFFKQGYRGEGHPDWRIQRERMKAREAQIVQAIDAAYDAGDLDKAYRLEDAQVRLRCSIPGYMCW